MQILISDRTKIVRQRGMTLVEILAVVVILGLIAATLAVSFSGTFGKAKRELAKSGIGVVVNKLELYRIEHDQWPGNDLGLLALSDGHATPQQSYYLGPDQMLDPWNRQYLYVAPGPNGAPYEILSYGADGQLGGEGENAFAVAAKSAEEPTFECISPPGSQPSHLTMPSYIRSVMPARRRRHVEAAVDRSESVRARPLTSPTGKWIPSMSCRTFSAIPPSWLQTTGRPIAKASWITSGEFSHHVDGTTTQAISRIFSGSSRRSYLPAQVTRSPSLSRRSAILARYSGLAKSRFDPCTVSRIGDSGFSSSISTSASSRTCSPLASCI